MIVKKEGGERLLIQDGYEQHTSLITSDQLKKRLKILLKKEFPRSNKVRLYTMGEYCEQDAAETQQMSAFVRGGYSGNFLL
jgi:hypothetical protein